MTIVLDTPEKIDMWVLLSRRGQVQLHLKGYKVKGIMAALKRIPGCENITRVAQAVVPIEFAISQAGGNVDYGLVNLHVLRKVRENVFQDLGIYDSPDVIQDGSPLEKIYAAGQLEVVLTLDAPRKPNGNLFTA